MIAYDHKVAALDVIQSKIHTREILLKSTAVSKFLGKKIVFTNGCFDIIHRGHIDYLAKASDLGSVLIVGVNSDESVKRLGKSPNRPLQDETTRAMILASLHFVNSVIIFNEDTPEELIRFIKPDILVKGADYDAQEKDPSSKKYIVGSDLVTAAGGAVKTIEFLPGFSTTAIEQKIKG
jgi:rfaE bifunctional protein nucleotidyltransferase chain/domain